MSGIVGVGAVLTMVLVVMTLVGAPRLAAAGESPESPAECLAERGVGSASRCLEQRPADVPSGSIMAPPSPLSNRSGGPVPAMAMAAAMAGAAVGVGATLLVTRRRAARQAAAPAALPVPAPMLPQPAAPEQLVRTLIDLVDRVPSAALREDVLAALTTIDVHPVVIDDDAPFDAATMHGIAGTPAIDAATVGTVAHTERPGFRNGADVIRLPDVVVFTAH